MSFATQTDISQNPKVGQTQDSSKKRPEVVIRIRQTETNDESNTGSTNIELLEALDALDPYQDREDGDHPVTKCGGRIFRTPVFHSSHDESMSGEGEGNGNHNILPKVGICEEESGIVGAIAKWVDRIQSDRNQENKLKWSVLISPHLYADLNLAVKEHIIDYDSLQVFFIGENLPTFILTLYDLTKSSETTTTVEGKPDASETTTIGDGKSESSETTTTGEGKPVKSPDGKAKSSETNTTVDERPESSETTQSAHSKDEGSARKFALQLAQELTVELHKFCCVDFLLLPCAMTYNAFIGDLLHNEAIGSAADTALQQQIEQEQSKAQWYYSGPLQLSKSGYREVEEATTLVAGVSYVPYIMSTAGEQSAKNKTWLLKLNPSWRRALSLLIEALGSTEDATYTLTCSEDKYRTVEMIVLEAARRWAFSHDVVLRTPTHLSLGFEETQKDLLHLTGKRMHTRYRIEIKKMDASADPGLECGRYRGKSEAAHLRKRADVLTSEGGRHVGGVYIGEVQVKTGAISVDKETGGLDTPHVGNHPIFSCPSGMRESLPENKYSEKVSDRYNMNHENRGQAIIINNKHFDPLLEMGTRKGTDVDAHNLRNILCSMGFSMSIHVDCTAKKMTDIILKVVQQNHADEDCFVLVILAHGKPDKVCATDDLVDVDDLLKPLKTCPSLAGKPKIIIIQTCRGEKLDEETDVVDTRGDGEDGDDMDHVVYRVPVEADFLMALACVPCYLAWRKEQGSWFVQALVEVLRENWAHIDLLTMMTRASKKVALDFESTNQKWFHKKQVPCISSMLTRDVYFTPKKSVTK